MVIYITDRYSKVIAKATSELPENKTLLSDLMTDDLASGVKTYECELIATDALKTAAVSGNYLLAGGQLYTIVSDDYNNLDQTISLYCEDAGLDFLNRVVGEVAKTSKTLEGWVTNTLGSSSASGWTYYFELDKNISKTLEYTSSATATERLLDILDNYDAEMYFTYEIDGFDWVQRTINFVKSRGIVGEPHHLYMDYDVEKIIRHRNIENLATVWIMYGKDNKPLSKLTGYDTAVKTYSRKGHSFTVTGNEIRCTDRISAWRSALDTDGRIVQKQYTEYAGAQACINYGIREMVKIVDPVVTYEATLRDIYDGAQCGDHVDILDTHNDILLNARIITLKRSYCSGSISVTLGEFTQLKSSKATLNVSELPQIYTLSITSNAGTVGQGQISATLTVTIYLNGSVITDAAGLPVGHLVWYENGVQVLDTDPRISDNGFTFTTGTLTVSHTYKCALEE